MNGDAGRGLPHPWGAHSLAENGDVLTVRVGPLVVWARMRSEEVWLAHEPGDWSRAEEEPAEEPPPESEGWTRWPVPDAARGIRLSPAFPPRPVVVKPELSFRLLPRTTARIYVRVPLWVQVTVPRGGNTRLTEIPTLTLSDTWWGEFSDGELCYWLPTSAQRRVRPGTVGPHQAVCPLDLSNRSGDELEVEKVALRVAHLSIFRADEGFWADATRVRYRGAEEGSEIEVTGRAPESAAGAVPVTEPRSPLTRSFRARTFSRLRTLSGLEGL